MTLGILTVIYFIFLISTGLFYSLWIALSAVDTNLSYILSLSHVCGDGASIPGAVGSL